MTIKSSLNGFPFYIHLDEGATRSYSDAYTLNLPRRSMACNNIPCSTCPLYIPNTHYECADLAVNYLPESLKSSYPELLI